MIYSSTKHTYAKVNWKVQGVDTRHQEEEKKTTCSNACTINQKLHEKHLDQLSEHTAKQDWKTPYENMEQGKTQHEQTLKPHKIKIQINLGL